MSLYSAVVEGNGGGAVVSPATPDRLPDAFSRRLFEMSSVLPDPMADCARRLGIQVEPGARTLICNARMRDVMRALITGSQMA